MKPDKAALHNHKQAQYKKQEQKMTKRTFKVALVVKPDGDWLAVGGNAPENDRMARAMWGSPDGSFPVWAIVEVALPASIAKAPTQAHSEAPSEPFAEGDMGAAPPPAGLFVGPGEELPIVDLDTVAQTTQAEERIDDAE